SSSKEENRIIPGGIYD
nr:cystatin S [human, Peptide Partial, 16 aa] [Homo sapiens]AAB21282.1 cystatin S [human, saliva, Peptide Partial, 16 aa] [Homo sapiens]